MKLGLTLVTIMVWLAQTTLIHGQTSCIFNSTHCSCNDIQFPATCLRNIGSNLCEATACTAKHTCDCSGTNICSVSSCSGWAPSDSRPMSSLTIGETVSCVEVTVNLCLTKAEEVTISEVPEPTEYRMVQYGTASLATMFNMTTFPDIGDTIANNFEMHSKWRNPEQLRSRYITVRRYLLNNGTDLLCGIHGTYGQGITDDGLGLQNARVTVKGVNGQALEWAACDGAGECGVSSNGNDLEGNFEHDAVFSDGWCIKPLEQNGNAISIVIDQINNMKGIVFQSPGGMEKIYHFAIDSALGLTGTVDSNGLVTNGAHPEILFDLSGIAVPL